nr:hypothetical protein [Tanacetum cinerariifolium]
YGTCFSKPEREWEEERCNTSGSNLEVVKDGVVPSVNVASGNTQVKNMGNLSSGPSLPTQDTTSGGKSSYANVTGKPSGKKLKIRTLFTPGDNIIVAMPKIIKEGHYICNVRVKYEWKHPRCASCKVFGHIYEECPKNTGAGEKKTLMKPSQTSRGVPDYPITDKSEKFEELLTSGKATLVDEAGNPLKNVKFPDDYDSEDEVASVDNDMAHSMASEKVVDEGKPTGSTSLKVATTAESGEIVRGEGFKYSSNNGLNSASSILVSIFPILILLQSYLGTAISNYGLSLAACNVKSNGRPRPRVPPLGNGRPRSGFQVTCLLGISRRLTSSLAPFEYNDGQASVLLVPIEVNRVILFEIRCLSLDVRPTVSLFWVLYKLYLHDDFPSNFNQDGVERRSEFLVSLRPPLRHLLYINMDTFLKLPTWIGTIVSKGDPIPEDQRPKLQVTPPLLEGSKILNLSAFQMSVEMPNTKIAAFNHTQSSHQGHELVDNLYVPNWEHQNDLRVCTYRACRELVNHVATLAEDEFLGTLSNAELNHDYMHLKNRRDTDLAELERLGSGLRKANQDKDEITKKFTLLDNAHSKCTSREKELLDMVKSLAAPVQLCFTAGWLGRLALGRTEEEKSADSCDLPLSELWSVHPDAPSPEGVTLGAATESTIQQPPSTFLNITSDIPFRTTT